MSLELYLGPMFAGKSSEILGILRRNRVIGRPTLCLTSSLDTRFSDAPSEIISHNHETFPAVAVNELLPILKTVEFREAEMVIIEEAQFFPDLKEFVIRATETHGKHLLCVGLDGDSERRPFGQLLDLIPLCDRVVKLRALCTDCADGTEAIFTFRDPTAPTEQIHVGASEEYLPLCRCHYLERKVDALREDPAAARTFFQQFGYPEMTSLEFLELCIRLVGVERGSELFRLLK